MLLPLIGEGRDGEFPARDLFCRHSEQRSVIQNPLQLLPMRHTGLDTESPTSSEGFKLILPLAIRQTMRL